MSKINSCLLFIFSLISISGISQSNFNSPYSRFGIGQYMRNGVSRNYGMGGVGVSTSNSLFINNINPALSARTNNTVMATGLLFQSSNLESSNASQSTGTGNLNYFALSLPVSKKWTTGFGLKPYSMINYNVSQSSNLDDTTSVNYLYEGEGSVNQFYFNNGIVLFRGGYVGLEASYLFGKTTTESSSQLSFAESGESNSINYFSNRDSYSGFSIKPGFAIRREVKVYDDSVRRDIVVVDSNYINWKSNIRKCIDTLKLSTLNIQNPAIVPYDKSGMTAKEIKKRDKAEIKRVNNLKEQNVERVDEHCNECFKKPKKKVKYTDTLVLSSRLLGINDRAQKVASNGRKGRYLIVFNQQSNIKFSNKFKDFERREEISELLVKHRPKGYGIYVMSSADSASNVDLLEELKNIVMSQTEENESSAILDETKNYIKRGSGIFLNGGITYELGTKLSVTSLRTNEIRLQDESIVYQDTLEFDEKGKITLPSAIHFGIGIEKPTPNKNSFGKANNSIWSIGADFSAYKWSGYENLEGENPLYDSYRVALGGEIVPNLFPEKPNVFSVSFYRLGVHYERTPYQILNATTGVTTQINDFGIDFGWSIPVYNMNSRYDKPRYLTFGFTVGKRGTIENNMIKENYFNMSVGLTINADWFRRQKEGL